MTSCWGWRAAGCTPTATPWSVGSSTHAGWRLDRHVEEFGRTLGEELLEPTRVYAADLLDLVRTDGVEVHALSHVTGGGLAANLARVLPPRVHARLDRSTWTPPPVFTTVGRLGRSRDADLERTLNMGVGFVAVVPSSAVTRPSALLRARGIHTWVMGEVFAAGAPPVEDGVEVVRGAKGVDGGSVQVVGALPGP